MIIGDVPAVPCITEVSRKEWKRANKAASDFLETAEHRPIGLPNDGETFNDPTLEAFRERLLHLREVSYNFPDYVLKNVEDEIADESATSIPAEKDKVTK